MYVLLSTILAFLPAALATVMLPRDGLDNYVFTPSKFQKSGDAQKLNRRSVLDVLLNRQLSCDPGYGYCANLGGCCPDEDTCCGYGYCLEPQNACCPNGPCQPGTTCCGYNHCHPTGTECCGDESYCEAGNICVLIEGYSYDVCCTDLDCTAYVTGGSTVSRTEFQTATSTSLTYVYYYFTITW